MIRIVLAVVAALLLGWLVFSLVEAAKGMLIVWRELQAYPWLVRYGLLLVLLALLVGGVYVIVRLLFPQGPRAPKAKRIDRATVDDRLNALESLGHGDTQSVHEELAELTRREQSNAVYVCVFGDVSAGKSSLIASLTGAGDVAVSAVGGTTTKVRHFAGELSDGRRLMLADVPGLHEADDEVHGQLARDEVARSHAVLFVTDADITRGQDQELRALAAFDRPVIVVLNKADRYQKAEVHALLQRFSERYHALGIRAVAVSAAHEATRRVVDADGHERKQTVTKPANLSALQDVLGLIAELNHDDLEASRQQASLAAIDEKLAIEERRAQAEASEAIVKKYTQRAVVGALAAVAPGTDLIIQGALATGMVRALCQTYGLPVRDVDIESFIQQASNVVRTSASVLLAIAGNALKAFPGMGTVGGGLVHAVAYGLIFDSLGRALSETLAATVSLDRQASLDAFQQSLQAPTASRLKHVLTMAWQASKHSGKDSNE